MGRLFAFIGAMILFARRAGVVPAAHWSDNDRAALSAFLRSDTGAKLQLCLTSQIAAANERATFKATTFECGWACGYRGLWAQFQYLSQVPAHADNPDELEEQGLEEFDHMRP